MLATYGPVAAAAGLLALSGAAKLRDPSSAGEALRSARMAVPGAGRLLGAGEVALAVWFLLVGGVLPTLAIGLGYLGFSVFVTWGRRTGSLADCGCFGGESRTPPSLLHAVSTGAVAVLVLSSAVAGLAGAGIPTLLEAARDTPWAGLPLVAGSVVVAWLLHLVLSVLTAVPAVGAPEKVSDGPRLFQLTVPPVGASR